LTSNGTIAVTGAGTVAQYVRGDGSLETFPALTGFVPYTGATADVNLGTHDLTAERGTFANNGSSDTLTVNHTSGSGYGIIVTKGGANEALYVSKTSGSGNAMTVVGGRTSLVDLALSSVTNTAGDFLTLSGGVVHKRTAAEVRTDIGAGTVTSVAALTLGTSGTDLSSTVANGTTTPVITLNVPTASATNRGALSSTDWSMFNNKENAITAGTTAQYFRGDKTFQTLNTSVVPELTNLYYTEARVDANTNVAANTAARHNAVTLGTANGLSLSTQVLSLGLASAGVNGALSGTDWNTFNNKANSNGSNASGTWAINITGNAATASAVAWSNISGQRTLTRDDAGLQGNAGARSGFFETQSPVNYYSGATSWQHLIESRHTNDSNNYAMQIAGSFFDQEFYVRKTNDSATTPWSKLWHSGNITPVTGTGTSGQVAYFTGTSAISSESNLFWDATNNRLGIGSPSPVNVLSIWQSNLSSATTLELANTSTGNNISKSSRLLFVLSDTVGTLKETGFVQSIPTNDSNAINADLVFATRTGDNFPTEKVRLFSDGNLLIGTSSINAGFKLDVNGTGRFSNILVANSDIHQVSTGGLYWGAASTYVIGVTGNTANGNLSFITGSTVKLTIASTGAATFSSTLQTGGDISLMNASGDIHIRMKDSSGNADRVLLRQATTNDVYVGDIDSNNGRLILRTNGNDAVTIASSGAVQINNISGSGNRIVIANSSNTLISAVIGSGLAFDGTTLTATGGSSGSISGSGTSGTIALFTGTSSIGNSVISQTSGSIGIGTATPNRKLEVITGSLTTNGIRLTYAQGVTAEGMDITYLNTGNTTTSFDSIYNSDLAVMQFRMKTFGTPVTALSILGSGAATFSSSVTSTHNTNGQIAIVPTTNTNAAAFLAQNAGGGAYFGKNNSSGGAFTGAAYATVVYSGGNVPMGFYTNDAERFRITSDGTIGFNGNSGIGNAGLDKMSMGYLNGNYGWIQTWSGTRLLINPSGNNVLIGTATDNGNKLRVNGTIWSDSSITATSFFESSDATIKTLVQDNYQAKGIESVVAKLYIKNGKQELGYFAQDLESILPSAVNKGTDGLLNLSYREVHTAKIAALEKEINELKKQLKNN
jgi:hypothetical protein